jgi:transposase
VNWSQWGTDKAGERLVLGIDVAKEDFVAVLLDGAEEVVARVKWRHPQGTAEFLAGVEVLSEHCVVEAVMEASGTYGDALRWQLNVRDVVVYRVSAKKVHDAAEVHDGVPSLHDAKAATIIADLHCRGLTREWALASEQRRTLSAQVQWLGQCKQRYQQELNRLEALLARHWPESLQILGLGSASLRALIAVYGDPGYISGLRGAAERLLRQMGRGALAEEKIQALLASAATTLGMPCVSEERALLRKQAGSVIDAGEQVREIERCIEQTVAEDALCASQSKHLGVITSAVLLASLGSPKDYADAGSYCKAIGLNLKEHSSGRHQGQLHITKRGPAVARLYLYFAALRLIRDDPQVQRWYALKTQRPGACKMNQVVELMRKLAKAIWHDAQGRPFDSAKLFNLKAIATP